MEGPTHRKAGVACCLLGYCILKSKGLLIEGTSPIAQVVVMYPFAIFGSVAPDMDHNEESNPCKDVVGVVINKILHIQTPARKAKEKLSGKKSPVEPFRIKDTFDARHRSWQTHSDLFLFIFLFILHNMLTTPQVSFDTLIWRMCLTGFVLGIVSHYIMDMMTTEGIWSIITCFINKLYKKVSKSKKSKGILPEKIRIVPNSKFFCTDGPWEKITGKLLWVMSFILLIYVILDASPYKITFDFLSN